MALDIAMALAGALASGLGFALLALSQERHWCAVTPLTEHARPGRRLTVLASAGLQALALSLDVASQGPGFGGLLWAVMLSGAAFAVAFTLSWRPGLLRPLARMLPRPGTGA